jgi:cell division protein FtsI/penicillin-binding protein 2
VTPTRTRIGVISGVFLLGLVVVVVHLWLLMVQDQEVWARRSYENRWAFRSVPSQRGLISDRFGRELARDVPTSRVSVYYHRFRLYHVVGAAVHGAMLWASLQPALTGTVYTYRSGTLGAAQAVGDLLDAPIDILRPGVLPKEDASALATYATTVLSACSGLSRRKAYAAMRTAATSGLAVGIGDVLDMSRSELLAQFDERLRDLVELDRRLLAEQKVYALRHQLPVSEMAGLIDSLESLRRASLADEHVTWRNDAGELVIGSAKEDVRKPFAHDVAFELAAALRVDPGAHPGIHVEPAVRREVVEGLHTSLGVLLGHVATVDKALSKNLETNKDWLDLYLEREMSPDWLDELVPEGLVESDLARRRIRDDALSRYRREMMVRERRGLTGIEAAYNNHLMGSLGMRFVEHDSSRREHRLWSHLRVESGENLRLTFDIDLQAVAERAVQTARARILPGHESQSDQEKLEAALAVVDVHTGDILCYAGAPIVSGSARDVPGVVWVSNGSIGSVIKPFVMVEHLESEKSNRPHLATSQIAPCQGFIMFQGRKLRCDHDHWEEGRDPIRAIAKSCNSFFYQASIGLEEDGLQRALKRFGMMRADSDDPFHVCWQRRIRGLAAAHSRMYTNHRLLPNRAIGYGVHASPVFIARAYAGLASGSLPTLGTQFGEDRPVVDLGDLGTSLDLVRQGLRECVTLGTAKRLTRLEQFQVHGKTGTAEVGRGGQNNAWFAGYLPWTGSAGVQLAFCAVVYWVPDKTHGGTAAGALVADFLGQLEADPALARRYISRSEGR